MGNCRELLYKPARREISGGGPHRPINAHSLAELKRAMKRPSRGGIKERLERAAVVYREMRRKRLPVNSLYRALKNAILRSTFPTSKHQARRSVTVSRDAVEDFPLDGASVDRQALHRSASLIKPEEGLAVISLTRPQCLPLIRHIREPEQRVHICKL